MYHRLGENPPPLEDSRLVSIQFRTVAPHPSGGRTEAMRAGKYMIDVAKITGMTPAMFTFNGM